MRKLVIFMRKNTFLFLNQNVYLRDLIRLLNGSNSLKLRFLKLYNIFDRISLDIDILKLNSLFLL